MLQSNAGDSHWAGTHRLISPTHGLSLQTPWLVTSTAADTAGLSPLRTSVGASRPPMDGWPWVLRRPPGADIDTYERCMGSRVETSVAQAMVWLAEDVQYELTGYEFVQWPIAGKRILEPS